MSDYSALKATIDANITDNGVGAITGPVLNEVLNEMVDVLGEGGGGGANLTGYVSVPSIADLPEVGQPTLGYLVGTNLYLYVGEGGDTAGGKYKNCGPFRGPKGETGDDGENGENGKSAYQIWLDDGNIGTEEDFLASLQGNTGSSVDYPYELVNNLETDDATKGLSAAMGKRLGDEIAKLAQAYNNLAPWAFKGTPSLANPMYKDVLFLPVGTAGVGLIRYGYTSTLVDYMMSPVYDLGEIGDNYSLTFSTGEVTTGSGSYYPGILYLDENMLPYSYHVGNANPRTVTGQVSANFKYIRLIFKWQYMMSVYVKDNEANEMLFEGAKVNLAEILPKESILTSEYWKDFGPNSKGDWLGWNLASTNVAPTGSGGYKSDPNYPYFKQVGANATDFSFGISKLVELPAGVASLSVEFSVGEVDSTMALRILNPSAGTANYYTANANPRVVTINTNTYTHVQLYFKAANYANCYIKDNTNNVILWQGGDNE